MNGVPGHGRHVLHLVAEDESQGQDSSSVRVAMEANPVDQL